MKTRIITTILFLASFFGYSQALEEVNIVSDALSRKFYIQFPVPPSQLDANLPLIIGLHGDGGTGNGFAAYSGIANAAATFNFIGVFPNAYTGGWNRAVQGTTPADDVLFIEDIIDYMCVTYAINRNRVYVTGHSAGGFMAYRLAIEKADKIAAIAPVAGNMYGDANNNGPAFINNYLGSSNFIKIPILHIHGDADGTVSYPDPNHQPDAWSEFPLTGFSYPTCGETTYTMANVTDVNATVKKIPFCMDGPTSKEITLLRIVGGGHEWPSTKLPDVTTRIVQFLLAQQIQGQPACSDVGVENLNEAMFQLYPNPVTDLFTIQSDEIVLSVQIVDLSGKEIKRINNSTAISMADLQPGIYFISIQTTKGDSTHKIMKK